MLKTSQSNESFSINHSSRQRAIKAWINSTPKPKCPHCGHNRKILEKLNY